MLSLGGWWFPVWGARHWYKGPIKTITEEELRGARVEGVATVDEKVARANIEYGREQRKVSI